uniref:OB-fold domain-containing protein n=2 Tax=Natrinema halophilum TaxID=1699371 RepID=A0A7D5KU41_9EURY
MNPKAAQREPITVDDVLESRPIAEPFTLLDCCLVSDGGGAVVLVSEEKARELDVCCGNRHQYPRAVCTACGAEDPPFTERDGTGTIYTYTTCHVPGEPGFGDRMPYVVGAVELAEGPRLLAIIDADSADVEVGSPVEVSFWRMSDEPAMPAFVPE